MGKRKRGQHSSAAPSDYGSGTSPTLRAPEVRKAGDDLPSMDYIECSESDDDFQSHATASNRRRRELNHIRPASLAFPRSAYYGYEAPLPITAEFDALNEFKAILDEQRARASEAPEYDAVVLENFCAYRPPHDARRPGEFAGLEKVEVDRGASEGLLFDGTLRLGDTRRYVQGVPFRIMTVDGYGDQAVTALGDRICIQSKLAKHLNIWYQLGKPSKEYARFYDPFLWLAEFAKHFVDYLLEMNEVSLEDFKFCFHDWLCARHEADAHFRSWLQACNLRDFRTTVSARTPYLWKECSGLDAEENDLLDHLIWREVHPYNLAAIPEQPNNEHRTIVTPFVNDMFKHMYFRSQLESRDATGKGLLRSINKRKTELGLTLFGSTESHNTAMLTPRTQRGSPTIAAGEMFAKGDVVCLDVETDGAWRSTSPAWYAYVQEVHIHEDTGTTELDVLWLYSASDTTIGAAAYPFENELFLSDNCGCGRDAIDSGHVKGKVDIAWFARDPAVQSGLFVRQKFRTAHEEGTDDFVTLQPSDFSCRCNGRRSEFEECRLEYDIGDTVLVKVYGKNAQSSRLEPAIIEDFDLISQEVVLRQLRKRKEMGNELVLTDLIISKPAKHIVRACHVRTFDRETVAAGLPTGYDRGGADDFYYIVKESDTGDETPNLPALPQMAEGLDLVAPPPFEKLTGMGIFCGGGNFDRGLEDSGAVDFKYAVDRAQKALYTYRANSREPDTTRCFLGSVNDYIACALRGDQDALIARVGTLDLISAGSPCPGFSNLQRDKASDESLRNASMVASVVSFVDLYSPQYCVLENVVSMTAGMGGDKKENVFSQVIAAFVAMGYQVQQFLTDAWSHGSSQSRSRVFIVASAPGLEPFPPPQMTHDHPTTGFRSNALGRSSNGRSFGVRRNEYTPFRCTTAADATSDLPDIGDGQSRICPPFPDHCLPSEEDAESRERIASVPTRPYGMGLADAVHNDLVAGKPRDWLLRSSSMKRELGSKSYSRIRPNGLFPAVTTAQKLACGFTGRTLHWDQDRPLTVLELRRAMGFLDHEPIIGSPRQQVHVIGNSVDRKVSFALGLCLRESWSKSSAGRAPQAAVRAQLMSPNVTEEVMSTARPRTTNAFSDMLRAGASAVAGLAAAESEVLRAKPKVYSSATLERGRRIVDLAGDESETEYEEEVPAVRTHSQSAVSRPTAYVQIERRVV